MGFGNARIRFPVRRFCTRPWGFRAQDVAWSPFQNLAGKSCGNIDVAYMSASPNGPDGAEWCKMGAAPSRIWHVEQLIRLGSKEGGDLNIRIVEAESSTRHDRNSVARQEKRRAAWRRYRFEMGW